MAKALMFQGTGSGVGKSLLTAGFCRLLKNAGVRVAPFKSQNMALNAGVTPDGLEMGRAQILQAEASGIEPDVRMNPILLKPQGQAVSQLVRMGKVAGTVSARGYYKLSEENFAAAKRAYDSLSADYDAIIIEGAGSPAEINLQQTDIVNMRMAEYAGAKVNIVADIDRGGVFAWMKGTYDLVPEYSKKLISGFIINKFRGDVSLLQPGIDIFKNIVPVPVLGVMPYMKLSLEEEDSQDIASDREKAAVKIGVIRLPHISNFSDFAPLKAMKSVQLVYLTRPEEAATCDMLIIPGSKHTIYDMKFLESSGFAREIKKLSGKVPLIGICGGFQMLGEVIDDPDGIEGEPSRVSGLGLLPLKTVMTDTKKLTKSTVKGTGRWGGLELKGYEMHMGQTENRGAEELAENGICLWDQQKKVFGTYLHGFFETASNLAALRNLTAAPFESADYHEEKERQLDLLADTIKQHCDTEAILRGIL